MGNGRDQLNDEPRSKRKDSQQYWLVRLLVTGVVTRPDQQWQHHAGGEDQRLQGGDCDAPMGT